jgi:hypothetical protein
MPLFDLFKKSPKKEPAHVQPEKATRPPSQDDSLFDPEMQKKRYEAAMEFVAALKEKTPLVGGVPHAGTVLAVAAGLAGSSLYRSLNYKKDIAPGVVVLSEDVNEAWPQLLDQFAWYCKQHGMDVMSRALITEFPEQHKPFMTLDEILAEYQDQYQEIMKKHALDYLEGARTGMIVSSFFFEYFCKQAKVIDPFVATGIVAMGVVEGAKTTPPPMGTIRSSNMKHDRLILGEREAAMQEARAHGGEYIDPNPGVLEMLRASNVDPQMIYEQALIQKIEAKISRIDFARADVDQLYEEWKSKPETQAPHYVRLILWLKKNASAHGYEQSGNSWVRKR